MILQRTINLPTLLEKKSHFLLAPVGTEKPQPLQSQLPRTMPVLDLLSDDLFSLSIRRPSALQEFIPTDATVVAIDEIQKIPGLLDEVHRIIEARKIRFLLTGSSA